MEVSSGPAYVHPAAYPHAGPFRLNSDVYVDFLATVCMSGVKGQFLPVRVCLGLEPEEDEWTRFYLRI